MTLRSTCSAQMDPMCNMPEATCSYRHSAAPLYICMCFCMTAVGLRLPLTYSASGSDGCRRQALQLYRWPVPPDVPRFQSVVLSIEPNWVKVSRRQQPLPSSPLQELLPAHLRSAVGRAERRILNKSVRAWNSARGRPDDSPLDDATLQVYLRNDIC